MEHFNGPQTKFIGDSLYKHPVVIFYFRQVRHVGRGVITSAVTVTMAELEDKQSLQVPGAGAGLQFIRAQARGAENAFVNPLIGGNPNDTFLRILSEIMSCIFYTLGVGDVRGRART